MQLEQIKSQIPSNVTLVAVSKTHPVGHIMKAYEAGQRDFGENKVQELTSKAPEMPADVRWHLIGHLQRNKVKYIIEFVHLIHSVDSLKLLVEINKRAATAGRVVDCLLQVHIAEEDTKFGLDEEEVGSLLANPKFSEIENVRVRGLMGMATFTDDKDQVRREFANLSALFERLKQSFESNDRWQPEVLSMGMSSDFQLAIEEGSTMIRVGSSIFGTREPV